MKTRTFVIFAENFMWTDIIGENRIIPAGCKMKLHKPHDYIAMNGDVIFGHWYGYGQSLRIPKKYLKNTA